MKKIVIALMLLAGLGGSAYSLYDGSVNDVMLQGFHWESHTSTGWWDVVKNNAQAIADGGFTMVWLPPSSDAGSDEGYLPRQLSILASKYGSQAQLQGAISALHSKNVKAIADIVINHRVGTANWADFSNPTWGSTSVCANDEWPGGPKGNNDTGEGYAAARDIDHTQGFVQQSIKDWLNWLKGTIGYDGWRYDFVKGFGGSYVGMYNDATAPYFSVGEFWPTASFDPSNPQYWRQDIINWIDATAGKSYAFDFVTKPMLQQAFNNNEYWRLKDGAGKAPGVIGYYPAKAVTFLDNHDTGPSTGGGQNHWPFPSANVAAGYAYILTHPGIPSVYWCHYFDWGTALQGEIKKLMQIRKQEGINKNSTVSISIADSTQYGAIIDGKVAVKIGFGSWTPGTGWNVSTSGANYCVWTKSTSPNPNPGTIRTVVFMLKETVTGQDIFVKGGHDAGLVPSVYPAMNEPIIYNNTKNTTTAAIKALDASLDWGSESALDWTCNAWPASWGAKMSYGVNGYGEDPENTFGLHYWKLDVMMSGSAGEWFEFKAFMRQGTTEWWENNIAQGGTPYSTINHWGKKGYKSVTSYGGNTMTYYPL